MSKEKLCKVVVRHAASSILGACTKSFNILASLYVVVEFMASTINTMVRGQTVQVQQSVLLAMVVILHTICMGSLERLAPRPFPMHVLYTTLCSHTLVQLLQLQYSSYCEHLHMYKCA